MKTCKSENCERTDIKGSGYCQKCYAKLKRAGYLGGKKCKVEGCNGIVEGNGYCGKHNTQYSKYGKTLDRTPRDPNEIIDYGNYIGICLYNFDQEKIAEALVDKEDEEIVRQYKWSKRDDNYVVASIGSNRKEYLHRIIIPHNYPVTDHINMNPLDNRKQNLRPCYHHENKRNHGKQPNNTSGVTGVGWSKSNNMWQAYIQVDSELIHLGFFYDFNESVKERKEAEKRYFKEFAPA